jgi:metal-responsive CopG/Arc/MetJ family transcriptional regulator
MTTISARIDEKIADEIDRIMRKKGIDRSSAIRELLQIGIKEYRQKEALELLRKREITVWKAAELAQVTYQEILGKLREHNIPFPVTEEELKREFEEISSK